MKSIQSLTIEKQMMVKLNILLLLLDMMNLNGSSNLTLTLLRQSVITGLNVKLSKINKVETSITCQILITKPGNILEKTLMLKSASSNSEPAAVIDNEPSSAEIPSSNSNKRRRSNKSKK